MKKKRIVVIGATGLVGQQVVHYLEKDNEVEYINCLVRTPLKAKTKKNNLS